MTVSRDIAPARPLHEPDVEAAPAVPSQSGVPARPAVPSQVAGPGARPAAGRPSSSVPDVVRVRRGVAALRRALAQGTVHHHGDGDEPAAHTPGVEVVRAWADGQGLDEQRRVCRTCGAAAR